ncbi:MAG: group II intron reverse transcriptase/maturase [Actinomycetota bacterium]|nr:group II intron reverse transcriptase/maturase [Actinomycetota bacterium]
MSATAQLPAYEWSALPWCAIERWVFKLQRRIYRAMQRGHVKAVHNLQRLLLKSWAAKCLAVRRVAQDNQGKRTAGVDGVATLTPAQRCTLVKNLSLRQKPRPVRRVWIPKPRSPDKRPLGIPVMHDRAAQALVKLVLEPAWEARFEPNSYGFRPGRSADDAIQAIHTEITSKDRYVLDADIQKCFDRIDHGALLAKLDTFPSLRRTIRGWLKAGVMDGPSLFPTAAGTPQGGVISPLLANIALHGLETFLSERCHPVHVKVIRYADDFVILSHDRTTVEQAQAATSEWLSDLGLELQPTKTRLAHTWLRTATHPAGFDFLGFTVRSFPTRTHRGSKGTKAIIKPSKESQKGHYRALARLVERHQGSPQMALIADLNPVIRGWAQYYSTQVSSACFSRLDWLLGWKLIKWARWRHPGKPAHWRERRYWRRSPRRFIPPEGGRQLTTHADIPIRRHVKVRGSRSPFDGDWVY